MKDFEMDQKYYWVTSVESWALSGGPSGLSVGLWGCGVPFTVFEPFYNSVICSILMILSIILPFRNANFVH